MISETRTKVVSWLKSPKSIAAKVGISLFAVTAVSVPVAAVTMNNSAQSDIKANQSIIAENTDAVQQTETSAPTETEHPDVNEDQAVTPPTNTQPEQISEPTPDPEPTPPPTPIYSDTYPANLKDTPASSKFDQWGLNNRQSTSYTAWKVNEAFGNMPKWGYTSNGNADNWPTLADNSSIARGTTAKVHSVGVVGNFTVWVEAVNGDNVTVSFYNLGNTGEFGIWENISASKFSTYIYFDS